ncbi:hypothetical protein [Chryseobacterium sp. JUb7]|uniref:hypothetical protein n=1 Tax=Chryseobacterium sp. JUb7 TaxID=2940599 RepID=UPI002167A176|nr:hypothetical protein [Chryseobacterium sp. JUb7]MCS3533129.1 hypothetical protein [Chryseobacterium sp. JUb7]
MIDFLNYIHRKQKDEILTEFEDDKVAKQYLDFLEKKEFIFYSTNSYFPDLSLRSINEDTSSIYFVTIVFSQFINENLDQIISNLNGLGVKRLHFHLTDEDSMSVIWNILNLLKFSRITNLSFTIPYQKIDKEIYKDNRLKTVYLYNSPKEKTIRNFEVSSFFIKKNSNNLFTPKFGLNTVDVNTNTFNIANNYNLSLYKTIFVDGNGIIRFNNLDRVNYGNITNSLHDIETKTIKKLSKIWNIQKKDIFPCNNCEFRFCCSATYIPKKENDKFEIECNYNPYNTELT